MLLFQTHQSCSPPQVQNFKAQRIHHITIHNSKNFPIAISITSPCSKAYNSAVKVHSRLKFKVRFKEPKSYFLFYYRITSLL